MTDIYKRRKIRVLVVDDSAMARNILVYGLHQFPYIDVVGSAPDPYVAKDQILKLNPDVITLDVEMPRMDGLTFLKVLMDYHPMPVIMVSSVTKSGCDLTIRCLETGAADFITKPDIDETDGAERMLNMLAEKIRYAARMNVIKKKAASEIVSPPPLLPSELIEAKNKILAIGASTGGIEAIRTILSRMPANAPGIIVTQHMPELFTKSFAERLNNICQIEVREAKCGDSVIPGLALIAPGNYHMTIKRSGAGYNVETNQYPEVNGHRPSIDVMFESVAKYVGNNAVGVILTGMGTDGATGLLTMRENGARTIAQDEKSCAVFGMPKAAIELGAAERITPMEMINKEIFRLLEKKSLSE
ncbi:MAG: chemotaxis response regulator protein-glutamate methylesterase [Planctomycetes bacterium RBG_16_43_13]|nr:MAG: chemotaxis response regulator protein-glutamate methylesterase [Planctomycetes bacterium RBG_16_43_13]